MYEVPLSNVFELLGLQDDQHRQRADTTAKRAGGGLHGWHARMKQRLHGR